MAASEKFDHQRMTDRYPKREETLSGGALQQQAFALRPNDGSTEQDAIKDEQALQRKERLRRVDPYMFSMLNNSTYSTLERTARDQPTRT
uniref:Uncharacterized protein n=1 Tax=Trichuris muris TaxID=70415 RepID=A0A5S6Q7U2_TRIMR